ncbi:MAG: thioredoxin domain-containing protein [Chitinispirillaceae bacterium]|nr:thioredoxin domain-containing protein [Chitinispirillaceae bacterium]
MLFIISIAGGFLLGAFVVKKNKKSVLVVSRTLAPFDVTRCTPEGNGNAPVTVVEFSDMDCPYSRRNSRSMDSLKRNYSGRINYCYRHFPLAGHEHASLKARAVIAAGFQGKAAKMREILCGVDMSGAQEETLNNVAAGAGLDVEKFTNALQSAETGEILQNDIVEGRKYGVRSTPTSFINGYLIKGAVGFDVYSRVIDKLLAKNP